MNYSKFKNLPFEERFWNKVKKTDTCWLWKATKTAYGYGQLGGNGKRKYAHRVSYEMAYGKIPKGMLILHQCDIKACVNPSHLKLGNHSQNLIEAYARGLHKMSAGGQYART